MYKITVQNLAKKAMPADFIRYKTVRHLLAEYNKNKEVVKSIKNVEYACAEMQKWIKDFRYQQKEVRSVYKIDYDIKNRTWKKMIGKVNYDFEVLAPLDKSIVNNVRHLKLHKGLIQLSDKATKFEQLKHFKKNIREKFQQARRDARKMRVHRRSKHLSKLGINIAYEVCGGVMHNRMQPVFKRGESPRDYMNKEMGAFMKFLKSKDKQIVFQEKKPQTKDNYIGCEIEFFCDLNQEDLSFKLFEHGLGKNVCLKTDGSIRTEDGMYPHEVTILAKEKDIYEVIEQVSKVLLAANAKVNKSCGMHVHLDMRNRDHVVAFHNLVSAQNILFAMNPFSRQSGSYCKRQETKVFNEAINGGGRDMRYFGINATAHAKHNTIEVRIHSGTVQASKINNWIKLLLLITNKKEAIKRAASTLRGFIKQYDVDAELGMYIASRMAMFVGEDKREIEERGAA
jgi:hypothetical protein